MKFKPNFRKRRSQRSGINKSMKKIKEGVKELRDTSMTTLPDYGETRNNKN